MAKVKIRSFDMSISYSFPFWIKLTVMKAGRVMFNFLSLWAPSGGTDHQNKMKNNNNKEKQLMPDAHVTAKENIADVLTLIDPITLSANSYLHSVYLSFVTALYIELEYTCLMLLLILTSNSLRDFSNVYILVQLFISTLNTARFQLWLIYSSCQYLYIFSLPRVVFLVFEVSTRSQFLTGH